MPEARCPKCGSLMVLRIAKRGSNAGGKFYGCSRYPNCKATIPFDSAVLDSSVRKEEPEKQKHSLTEIFFPRTLRARERFQNHQVRFFETVAVPEDLLDGIDSGEMGEGVIKAFSQWRVDFPTGESKSTANQRRCQIISILEKILTRGRTTLLSPQLEKEFREIFLKTSKAEPSLSLIESLLLIGYQKSQKYPWLDSKEETIFYKDIISKLLGDNYEQFVLPQVEISSLLPPNVDAMGSQRVDFAIFHPRFEEKIVVEIDGEQHKRHIDADKERDRTLQEYGYAVIRIQTSEIQEASGPQLSVLKSKLSTIEKKFDESLFSSCDEIVQFIRSIKIAHQIQIVLLQAIQSSFLNSGDIGSWHIIADLDELGLFDKKISAAIIRKSVADFVELLRKLSKLYSVKLRTGEPSCSLFSDYTGGESANTIYISFSDKFTTDLPTFHLQNIYFPFHIANSCLATVPLIGGLEKPEEKVLEYFLRYLFRKSYFWEGQYDGITRALQGKDALLLLPTGAGKSLVYQLASLLLPGRTVVIDPIISLMEDQIDNLTMVGIDRCIAITRQIIDKEDRSRAIQLFGQGEYLFAYVAPERFQTVEFRDSLRTLTVHTPVALIVVDEAHCVSEWGHDFRTAYLNIGRTSRAYCESSGYAPSLLALTGTASRAVLKDVQRELQIKDFDAVITPKSFDRSELKFCVIYSTSQEKNARLKGYLGQMLPSLFNVTSSTLYQVREKETYSGLVFCPHVGGEFGVERVSNEIEGNLGISTDIYSGKEPKHWQSEQYHHYKRRVTKEFKRNKIPLLVCTKAFGMGIDKPNIRYTIHFGIPSSIESFYQEAGRAGRDRRIAHCCIIVSNDNPDRSKKLLNPNTKVESIDEIVRNISWEENDDITRALYFHTGAFRGIAQEEQDIEEVLRHLGDVSKKGKRILSIPDKIKQGVYAHRQPREITEKALHRLLLIGVVSDYTIEYSSDEFTVKLSGASKEEIIETYGEYIASYTYGRGQNEVDKASQFLHLPLMRFITALADLLLHFIYDVIERGRRRALNEMFLACTASSTDKDIRARILRYLEATEYSGTLEQIISDENAGIVKCKDIFTSVRSPNEAGELRGQVSRYLESYPDHPGLLMLRALSEILSRDRNGEVVRQNFVASVSSALTTYGLRNSIVFEFAAWAASSIGRRRKEWAKDLIIDLLQSYPSRYLARKLIEQLPLALSGVPAWFLLTKLQENCDSLVIKREV